MDRYDATLLRVPAMLRGQVVVSDLATFAHRHSGQCFLAPEPVPLLARLTPGSRGALRETQGLRTKEIIDYLARLGDLLDVDTNPYLAEAADQAVAFSGLPAPMVRSSYRQMRELFGSSRLSEVAETVGADHLDGWVARTFSDGRTAAVRAVGARAVHLIAGNSPVIAGATVVRTALARSDALIKVPSNDLLSVSAILRTMANMDPGHPLTRSVSAFYWKGGTTDLEKRLYTPEHVDLIVAWGGPASVRHVCAHLGPGLQLLTLDPKYSVTVLGQEAFANREVMEEVAFSTAVDIGALNQLGCVNSRAVYVAAPADRALEFGQRVFANLQGLPEHLSSPAAGPHPSLARLLDVLRAPDSGYHVIAGAPADGAIIVARARGPVTFLRELSTRTACIVPVLDPRDAVHFVDSSTQTVGIYPPVLRRELRDVLALHGVQRLVDVGRAMDVHPALPHDTHELLRRMVRWIVDERGPGSPYGTTVGTPRPAAQVQDAGEPK